MSSAYDSVEGRLRRGRASLDASNVSTLDSSFAMGYQAGADGRHPDSIVPVGQWVGDYKDGLKAGWELRSSRMRWNQLLMFGVSNV